MNSRLTLAGICLLAAFGLANCSGDQGGGHEIDGHRRGGRPDDRSSVSALALMLPANTERRLPANTTWPSSTARPPSPSRLAPPTRRPSSSCRPWTSKMAAPCTFAMAKRMQTADVVQEIVDRLYRHRSAHGDGVRDGHMSSTWTVNMGKTTRRGERPDESGN